MKVVYTVEVVRELRAARQWYNRRAPGVGDRLVDLVDEKVGEVARAPASFPRDSQDEIVRRARVAKYPVHADLHDHRGGLGSSPPRAGAREAH